MTKLFARRRWPQKRVLERNSRKVLRGLPVPGTRGVPGRALEAVPLSFAAQATALRAAHFPALLWFPALFPAGLTALFRNSSPAPLSGANGVVKLFRKKKKPCPGISYGKYNSDQSQSCNSGRASKCWLPPCVLRGYPGITAKIPQLTQSCKAITVNVSQIIKPNTLSFLNSTVFRSSQDSQNSRRCCGCLKVLAGKVFRQLSTLLEHDSPVFWQREMLSLPRFGHFPARKMAAEKSALPSGTLLDFLL